MVGAAQRESTNSLPNRTVCIPVSISVQDARGGGSLLVPLILGCYFLSLLRGKGPEGRQAGTEAATRSPPPMNPVSASPGRMLLHSPGCYCQEMGFPELIKGPLSFLQDQPPFSAVPNQH